MIPLVALVIGLLGILGLFWLIREKRGTVSFAVWLPVVWLFISSSRSLSSWLYGKFQQGANYEEGSPLDRTFLMILIALGLFVVLKRSRKASAILRLNLPIVLFLTYCLASVLWSDFPFVTFKRWIRGAGDLVMILVFLTDPRWESALKWMLERIAFIHIPLSLIIIKYFPEFGRSYTYSGDPMWTGVSEDKNGLGAILMIFGSTVLWRMMPTYCADQSRLRRMRGYFARSVVFAINLYLMSVIDSKTALICALIAATLILVPRLGGMFRRPALLSALVVVMVASCYAVLFLGIGTGALETMGRNASLTGRTEIWAVVIPLAVNPLLGAGYENFWMGDRFATVARELAVLNQAHNGYLETYLNLGWIGLLLLGGIVVTGYRNIMLQLRDNVEIASLKLAFFTVCLVYNFTEATFKMTAPIWVAFLWACMAMPKPRAATLGSFTRDTVPDAVPAELNPLVSSAGPLI